jgi:transcriptional regulator with XRE-family HTH domain
MTDPLTVTIAGNLRTLREQRGLSQRALADAAGASGAAVALWETAAAQMRTIHLVALARALGVSVTRILGEDVGSQEFQDGYASGWAACRARMLDATGSGPDGGAP